MSNRWLCIRLLFNMSHRWLCITSFPKTMIYCTVVHFDWNPTRLPPSKRLPNTPKHPFPIFPPSNSVLYPHQRLPNMDYHLLGTLQQHICQPLRWLWAFSNKIICDGFLTFLINLSDIYINPLKIKSTKYKPPPFVSISRLLRHSSLRQSYFKKKTM